MSWNIVLDLVEIDFIGIIRRLGQTKPMLILSLKLSPKIMKAILDSVLVLFQVIRERDITFVV